MIWHILRTKKPIPSFLLAYFKLEKYRNFYLGVVFEFLESFELKTPQENFVNQKSHFISSFTCGVAFHVVTSQLFHAFGTGFGRKVCSCLITLSDNVGRQRSPDKELKKQPKRVHLH